MKKSYIKPQLEVYMYSAEKGFAWSGIGLHKDYVLIEGNERETTRGSEELSEYTDNTGEYESGLWGF